MSAVPESSLRCLRQFIQSPPQDVAVDAGMSADELSKVEQRHGFTFPPDLRALLSYGLPTSELRGSRSRPGGGFPNWRSQASRSCKRGSTGQRKACVSTLSAMASGMTPGEPNRLTWRRPVQLLASALQRRQPLSPSTLIASSPMNLRWRGTPFSRSIRRM